MRDRTRFSDRLVAAEQIDIERKRRYEMEMQQLLNPALPMYKRIICAAMGLIGLLAAVSFATTAVSTTMSGDYAVVGRAVFGLMAVLLLAFAFYCGKMAAKGTANARRDVSTVAILRWWMSFLLTIVALVLAWNDIKYNAGRGSAFYAGIAVVFVVFGAIHLITDQIRKSALSTQEKLLEMELKLAGIGDKLEGR